MYPTNPSEIQVPVETPTTQRTSYLQSKADRHQKSLEAAAVRRRKKLENISRTRERLAQQEWDLEVSDRRDQAISEGLARTLDGYRYETDDQRLNREDGNRVRAWHRDIRFALSGRLLAKNNPSRAVLVFDLLYARWARKRRPVEGITYPIESLLASTKLPRATLFRIIRKLLKAEIWDKRKERNLCIIERRRGLGRKVGRGGRDGCAYMFPSFPEPD